MDEGQDKGLDPAPADPARTTYQRVTTSPPGTSSRKNSRTTAERCRAPSGRPSSTSGRCAGAGRRAQVVRDQQDGLPARFRSTSSCRTSCPTRCRVRRWARRPAAAPAGSSGPWRRRPAAAHRRTAAGVGAGVLGDTQDLQQLAGPLIALPRADIPASWAGSRTLSMTVRSSSRLKNWKIMPIRPGGTSPAPPPPAGRPEAGDRDRPLPGLSSPAIRFSSVDLPLPDGPVIATASPSGRSARAAPVRVRRRCRTA